MRCQGNMNEKIIHGEEFKKLGGQNVRRIIYVYIKTTKNDDRYRVLERL